MEKNIVSIITAIVSIITAAIRKVRNARMLAIARKCICILVVVATTAVVMAPHTAKASELEIIIEVEVDENGVIQLYNDDEHIDGPLSFDSGGEPLLFVFVDADPNDPWDLDIVDIEPTESMTCERTQGVLECRHDGLTETEALLEAEQGTATAQKPLLIKPKPQSQPASTTPPAV